ncbi:hypothetical protein JCM1841_006121 [Sporobolomyces salmonicolor]
MDPSTDDSFVLVDPPHHQHQLVRPLAPFFPSLDHPSLFAWHNRDAHERVQAARQAAPEHALFLDPLLALAAIDGPSVYPPASPEAFHSLLYRLVSATTLSTLNLASILYYLVLAYPSPDSPQRAAAFAQSRLLPPAFALSIRAFHAFDSGSYPLAIRLLSDPRVREPDFVPKTLALLSSAPPAHESAKLVISYWRLTGLKLVPKLGKVGSKEVDVVLRALCDGARKQGVSEAWELARHWEDDAEREELMRTVLACCFGDNPARLPTPQHLHTLLSYPFHPPELALLTSFCLDPPSSLPSSAPSLVVDWFLSRLISSSQPLEALVFWAKVKAKGSRNVEHSDERERLLKAVEGTLTDPQKQTLELELSSLSPVASTATPMPAITSTTASVTQPAWAPTPAVAPSTPSAPPRTLAAARLAQLPPAPAPSPQAKDLPLSASPFVRKDGVLRALKEGAAAASPSRPAPGTPNRMVSAAGAEAGAPRAGSPFSFISSAAPSIVEGTPSKLKPTLAGFGTVRQPATPRPVAAPVRAQSPEEEEDAAMVESLRAPSPPPAPQQQRTEDRDFGRRVAQDPAVRATILSASTSRAPPSSSRPAPAPGTPQKRSRLSNGKQQRERGRQRGDKRRAVSAEPDEDRPEEMQERPDEGRTVKLPPGAFPGIGGDEPDYGHGHEHDEPEQRHLEERQSSKSKPRAPSSRVSTSTAVPAASSSRAPARRSTRTSMSSAALQHDDDGDGEDDARARPARTSRAPRASRASSLLPQPEPLEMSEVSRTPVRRSSRLSTTSAPGTFAAPAREEKDGTAKRAGGRGKTATTRRGRGKIDEEEEEDDV